MGRASDQRDADPPFPTIMTVCAAQKERGLAAPFP